MMEIAVNATFDVTKRVLIAEASMTDNDAEALARKIVLAHQKAEDDQIRGFQMMEQMRGRLPEDMEARRAELLRAIDDIQQNAQRAIEHYVEKLANIEAYRGTSPLVMPI